MHICYHEKSEGQGTKKKKHSEGTEKEKLGRLIQI